MKKIILIIFIIVLFASCDAFLDIKPSNSGDANSSIQTAADAEVFMNGIMRKMTSSSYYGRNMFMYVDAKGGDLAIASQGRGLDGLYTFNHSASSGSYSGFWTQIYNCLLQVNTLLKNIDVINAAGNGSEDLDLYRGQAMTARALMYFDLVRLYGKPYDMDKASFGVPLILEPLDASAEVGRSTVAEVYTQILKDLEDSKDLLSKKKANGYLNFYANRAILARVQLTMHNYPAALAAAKTIIEDDVYDLYENSDWVSSWSSEFGSESIFELGILLDEADLGSGSLGFYLMRSSRVKNAMGWFMASDYFIDRLDEDVTDVRKGIMDYDETSNTRFGSCNKYSGNDLKGDKGSSSAVNVKVIRLSEIYLIAAEAALYSDKAKAAEYLNEIRKRSPALAPATATNITIDMILDEKSKELFAEGQRYFDMIRLNKSITFNDDFIDPAVVITHREKTIDRTFYKTILPISIDELNANRAIKNQQNPGY